MSALVSAELLRLRSVRSTVPVLLGGLLIIVLTAVLNLNGSPDHFRDDLGGASVMVILAVASGAALVVAYEFKRGATALTYLAQPRRERVLQARMATYGAVGAAFAGVAVAACCAAGLAWADHKGADIGLTATDVLGRSLGGAAAGAVVAAAGVLLATVIPNPTAASQVVVLLFIVESFLPQDAVVRYLPFNLAQAVLGAPDRLGPMAALALLLLLTALLYVAVRATAMNRDLT